MIHPGKNGPNILKRFSPLALLAHPRPAEDSAEEGLHAFDLPSTSEVTGGSLGPVCKDIDLGFWNTSKSKPWFMCGTAISKDSG